MKQLNEFIKVGSHCLDPRLKSHVEQLLNVCFTSRDCLVEVGVEATEGNSLLNQATLGILSY